MEQNQEALSERHRPKPDHENHGTDNLKSAPSAYNTSPGSGHIANQKECFKAIVYLR